MKLRMRHFAPLIALIVLAGLAQTGWHARAQDPEPPLVAFVQDRDLFTASPSDVGPDGISTLERLFQSLGARTTTITLNEAVPDDAQVVVIVQPRRGFRASHIARLWVHVERGNHVLMALDPYGQANIRNVRRRDGTLDIFETDFGVGVLDAFVAEPWLTRDNALDLVTSLTVAYPAATSHPVMQPLINYELPVFTWGARSLTVDPIGMDSFATGLLYSDTAFGETERVFDNRDDPLPVEFTPEQDLSGLQNIAVLGENTRTGARFALIGDSEVMQNNFGLQNVPGTEIPLYPGDFLLVQRLAAWLLELPEDTWPALPAGLTWIALDGETGDWDPNLAGVVDAIGDASDSQLDLVSAWSFRDNDYLYIRVESTGPPPPDSRIVMGVDVDLDDVAEVVFTATTETVVMETSDEGVSAVPDAQMAAGNAIELRVPLRVIGVDLRLTDLCAYSSQAATMPSDCLNDLPLVWPYYNDSPYDIRLDPGPLVTVQSLRLVNLRRDPNTNSPVLSALITGEVLTAVGRDATGEWIKVRNARFDGWIAAFLLQPNTDLMSLPVVVSDDDS